MTLHDRAAQFRRLHDRAAGDILVLPNAWDAMSARLVEQAGARAIATTSSGVSWSLGRPDGEGLQRDEMLDAVRRIVDVVTIPVSADVERGYGANTPSDVADTARGVVDAGAVGLNLEDASPQHAHALVELAHQVERIAAARSVSDALFINARIDTYLMEVGAESGRLDETVRRAAAYIAAGADGIFVPGVIDAGTIERLVRAIDAPLNVLARPGAPTTSALGALGVARVSVGPGIARAAMACIRRAAHELLNAGSYEALADGVPFPEANALFGRR